MDERGTQFCIDKFLAYKKTNIEALRTATKWSFLVPPRDPFTTEDTCHFSVLVVLFPALSIANSNVNKGGNRSCIIGLDSFGTLHEDVHRRCVPYLRRYVVTYCFHMFLCFLCDASAGSFVSAVFEKPECCTEATLPFVSARVRIMCILVSVLSSNDSIIFVQSDQQGPSHECGIFAIYVSTDVLFYRCCIGIIISDVHSITRTCAYWFRLM